MKEYLNLFRILYLILLLFVFANFLLDFYGYAFTPLLWNSWLYLVVGTILCHIWYRFYRKHAPNWKNLVSVLLSLFASLILTFFIELFFSFDGHDLVTIHSEYYIKEKTIVFQRGSLLDAYDEYHELVNPFVMKKEIKKKVYID
jgi:CDP-diglyceride synthetase